MSYNTVAKILQSNCRQTTKRYVPVRSLWLSRVFVDLANTDEQHCLTIDCSGKKIKTAQVDMELRLAILKNRFAILTKHLMISYTMFSKAAE